MTANAASVNSGQNALYSITVSPKTGTADDVTVQISAFVTSGSAPTPVFTVCGHGDGSQVCTLGTLHSGQSSQMQGEIAIPKSAPTGDTFTLAAKVSGAAPGATAAGSVTGSASTSAVAPKPPSSPPPSSTPPSSGHHHHSSSGSGHHSSNGSGSGSGSGTGSGGSSGTTGNTDPLAGLPPLNTTGGSVPLGSLGSPGSSDPGGLFPTISPSPGATPAPGTTSTGSKSKAPYKATTVADVVPLNHGLVSGQIAGLIVLGLGIALVFARISLRKPKGSESKS